MRISVELFNEGSPTALNVPDWVVSGYSIYGPYSENYGSTPNGLYKKINQMKVNGNSSASMTKTNAPQSSSCN